MGVEITRSLEIPLISYFNAALFFRAHGLRNALAERGGFLLGNCNR
jgi:hypothetical protein